MFNDIFNFLTTGIAMVLLFIFILTLGPWLLFWSIGVLSTAAGYPVIIPLTFGTWLAASVFLIVMGRFNLFKML